MLTLWSFARKHLRKGMKKMKSIPLEKITVLGGLAHRLLLNSVRLESDIYMPDAVCRLDSGGWPADAEGRTLLALVRQMEATGREPSYLREILRKVYGNFNEKGYLGKILPEGQFDEQQLSGHNWLLRALLEYFRLTGSRQALGAAEKIVKNLYMPLKGAYASYPLKPEERVFEGRPDGELTGDCINGWYLSTDIGCAYMCMDGLSRAYKVLDMPGLKELLYEMAEEYSAIDFTGISMQTHATLSALRGILCFYESVRDEKLLDIAKRIFSLYMDEGMTRNYANCNWFGRPFWTEPCAIVDSFMAAAVLFRATGEIEYFETAQKIYFNALCHAQRSNGGFGLDNCTVGDQIFLAAAGDGGDAYWCCTMRGGEGLAEVSSAIAMEEDGVVHIGLYNPAELSLPDGKLEIITAYPLEGRVRLELHGSLPENRLALFVPSYAKKFSVTVNGVKTSNPPVENGFTVFDMPANSAAGLEFEIPLITGEAEKHSVPGYFTVSHGFLLLGTDTKEEKKIDPAALASVRPGVYSCGENTVLRPLTDSYKLDRESMLNERLQIVFRKDGE